MGHPVFAVSGGVCPFVSTESPDDETPGVHEGRNDPECPSSVPEAGVNCSITSELRECLYGEQVCCNKSYPEHFFHCMDGAWMENLYQTPCASGSHVDQSCSRTKLIYLQVFHVL